VSRVPDERGRPHEPTSAKTMLRRGAVPFLCGLLALGLLAFIVQNSQKASVHWLTWTYTAPLWVDLIAPAILAVLVAGLVTLLVMRRRKRKSR
jgi:uncharacterized integral membrane protein